MQTVFVTLKDLTCGACTIHFAVDAAFYNRCMNDGNTFYCPNGHARCFAESEVDKLKRQLKGVNDRLIWAEKESSDYHNRLADERKAHGTTKAKLTKTRKRIANGVCPCCHRTFTNVARHMDSKHPDFKEVMS